VNGKGGDILMDKKRRDFLKVAGISTLAGLGGTAVVDRIVAGASPAVANASTAAKDAAGAHAEQDSAHAKTAATTTGKRYGMVIDVRKFQNDPSLTGRKSGKGLYTGA
jgi:molybdopterin-containing oxidoreductase family iron-sulfur binding subunit